MTYDNNNSGAIFKEEERASDKHPHYKGKATIKGQQYYVSGWINEKNGKKYMSLKFSEPQVNKSASKASKPSTDDSVPW